MEKFVCITCGTQFPESSTAPESCPICEDERQYVGFAGQQWATMGEMENDHKNIIKEVEPNLVGIGSTPRFAIGQRAMLLQLPGGNLLWDCISFLDDQTITAVNDLGGINAIAISHPHFYSSMIEWAQAFNAPVFLHKNDSEYVVRPDPSIQFWEGATIELWDGVTLINGGGHFEGGTILHWPDGANGKGVLLTGDTINVVSDRRFVSFMYSYPNQIPLSASKVRQLIGSVEPFEYDRIYGAWWDMVVQSDAKTAVSRSAKRYIEAITD